MFEMPPRGYRAYYLNTIYSECVFLPIPVYYLAKWYRDFRIWLARHVTAPNSTLRRKK